MGAFLKKSICYLYWIALRTNGFNDKGGFNNRFILWKAEAALNAIASGIYLPIFFLANKSLLKLSKIGIISFFLPFMIAIALIINNIINKNFDILLRQFQSIQEAKKLKLDIIAGLILFVIFIWFATSVTIIKS